MVMMLQYFSPWLMLRVGRLLEFRLLGDEPQGVPRLCWGSCACCRALTLGSAPAGGSSGAEKQRLPVPGREDSTEVGSGSVPDRLTIGTSARRGEEEAEMDFLELARIEDTAQLLASVPDRVALVDGPPALRGG